MKKFIAILFIAISFNTYSQTGKVYFLTNSGRYVNNKDSADFMRVVDEPDSGSVNYKITEFYPNSVRKLIGTASVYWPKVIWEGPSITFDKNGKKIKQVSYHNSTPTGSAYYYYPNGRLMKELLYGIEGMNAAGSKGLKYKLMNSYDSTGVQLVKDGTGYMEESPYKEVIEKGNYANGVRDGVWKGNWIKDVGHYVEIYKNGEFVSGKNFQPDGKVIDYTVKEMLPKFPGGEKAFGQFISSNLKYPNEARMYGISGQVILSFVVQKDGSLTEIKVIKSPHYTLEEEALRVLRRSPKWEPGIQNGVPVRVQYTIPLSFRL
jgi:TonB family protein